MAQHREESYRGPTRRSLLKAAMAAAGAWAAPWVVPASVLGENPPSSRIHVGFIGTGNQSTGDLPAFLRNDDVQVLTVCDVNTASYGYQTPEQYLGREPARKLAEDTYGNHLPDHIRNFLNCVKTRQEPLAPVEIGHCTAGVCHLGNIAIG